MADDFSRWTIGSNKINGKASWVKGVRDWFDDGWRVSDRKMQHLEITVSHPFAFTRRIVTETYAGPGGESSTAKAALAEVWIKQNGRWKLLRVDVHPLESD